MKYQPSVSTRSSSRPHSSRCLIVRPIPTFRWLLMAGCLGLLATAARAQSELDIGVRSTILDKPDNAFGPRPEAAKHGKVYAILSVQPIPSDDHIVRPVDANVLASQVRHELDTHGFRPMVKGETPDILVTVQYGRAWLNNPYFGDAQTTATSAFLGGTSPDGGAVATQTITGAGGGLMKLQGVGIEAKAQKAQYEKLCIKVTAWEYPTGSKAKPKQLWHTIMNVDDPDHRDLNTIAAEMLAAGSPYFDKEVKEDEIDVTKPLPEGHVDVGTPEVVEPTPPKIK